MPFADRHFVDADHQRCRTSYPPHLFAHILLVQLLDCLPIQGQFFGHRLDRRVPAPSPHVKGKPFGVKRIVRQPIQTFALHPCALRAGDPPYLQLQVDSHRAAGQIAGHPRSPIVKAAAQSSALATRRFFRRRRRGTTRTLGSPNTPRTRSTGTKPRKRYASRNCRLNFRIHSFKQVFAT